MTHITRIVTPTRYVARRGEIGEFFATHRVGDIESVEIAYRAPFGSAPFIEMVIMGY